MKRFADSSRGVTSAINESRIMEMIRQMTPVDSTASNKDGDTLIHLALRNEDMAEAKLVDILERLLERGLSVNVQNKAGESVLHLAVERRMRDLVDLCLQRHAKLQLKDAQGNGIAHRLLESECRILEQLLQQRSGDKRQQHEDMLEHEEESRAFVDWLACRGVDFFYQNNAQGLSALYLANELNLQHMLRALLWRAEDLSGAQCGREPLLGAFLQKACSRQILLMRGIDAQCYGSRHLYDIVKLLLHKSASIDDQLLDKAFRLAVQSNERMDLLDMLVERIGNVNIRDAEYGEPLAASLAYNFAADCEAAADDYMGILRAFVLKGANLNERDRYGQSIAETLFHRVPSMRMLQMLKQAGADFNAPSRDKGNFLHLISRYGEQAGMVDLVMSAGSGCDVNLSNSCDQTPLLVASMYGNASVLLALLRHGAKVNFIAKYGKSPLSEACVHGKVQVAKILIEHAADVNCRDNVNKSLLHLAANDENIARLLIDSGLDVNAADNNGKRPLHLAKSAAMVSLLVKSGAMVDVQDNRGRTPLYDALGQRSSETLHELLKCGASVQDAKLIELARRCGHLQAHLVKMSAAGLLQARTPYALDASGEEAQKLYQRCLLELERLKGYFVDDCTSLYKLLHKNPNRMCAYVDNAKLQEFLQDQAMEKAFPNYFLFILASYNRAVSRKPLLQSAYSLINQLARMILPDVCADMILAQLSNAHLLRLIDACADFYHDDSAYSSLLDS